MTDQEKVRCKCARLCYRNRNDGKRDYSYKGISSCPVCRGSGYIRLCKNCDGAGMLNSAVCSGCAGHGNIRVENPGRWVTA